ncbi:Aldehyde reductase 2 [Talaromyces islandicus]|uniref:Aldehyde reductase 2 n=1 Tax=Talaromyces islandicus TaxID=28573 RepID=A0A0U1LXG2_TALIS|nr:Aldehyde reductase 2 [Talaromyces islandicus]
MTQEFAIPKGSTVVITGANGYIASHIADLLLELGYLVRGTVRSEKPWLDQLFEKKYGKGKFQSVVLPDLATEGVYKDIIKGAAAFVHVASDVSFSPDANRVIPPVVKLTTNALTAAAQEASVKRFVLTSSSSAALWPTQDEEGVIIDENSWNDSAVKAAWDPNTPEGQKAVSVYGASKTEGERAAWNWIKENKPSFVFNAVLPNYNTGPTLHPEIKGSTMAGIRNLLEGDSTFIKMFPGQHYIDVRDTARLHVAALLDVSIKDERIFAFVHEFNWTDVIFLLRGLRPDNKDIPEPPTNESRDRTVIKPKARAEQILHSFWGRSWVGFNDSVTAGIEGF